jgi:CRISPR/Cas system-associated exonuclease Cas4 (RecB family)
VLQSAGTRFEMLLFATAARKKLSGRLRATRKTDGFDDEGNGLHPRPLTFREEDVRLPVASYTFLHDWANCPHKAYRRYIRKDLPKFVHTKESKWGDEVHTAFEVRIKHGTAFPKEMEKFEAIAAPLVDAGAVAERMLGITAEGTMCDFFDPSVWLRGKIDAIVTDEVAAISGRAAVILDWKTGKRREEKAELLIHAVLLKAWKPTVQRITAHYVWLQENEVGKAHDVSDTEQTLQKVRKTMRDVENAIVEDNFPKRRNPLCGWCPIEDCEFNTKGR